MALISVMVLLLQLTLAVQPADELPTRPMAAPPETAAASIPIEALVNRVIDGNSLDAHIQGQRTAVGYLGAATPFAHQPCGAEALARNRELVAGRVVLVEDPAYVFDAVGRRLYYADTPDGISIEATLIAEGLARAVRTDAARGPELAALEADTQAAARGCLWQEPGARLTADPPQMSAP